MNYYQWHIGDYALHTSHLSVEEDGVYRRLLDYYYDTEQPIPIETQSVIRRLRLTTHLDTVGLILEEFFVLKDDGWHNLRADEVIDEYNKKADTARENGKKGGRPKKNKGLQNNSKETQSVYVANPDKTQQKANQEPRTKNHKPIKGLNQIAWDLYEKHRRLIKARKLKPMSVEKQQKWLVEQGDCNIQLAIVDTTIKNGWTGLFELKGESNGKGQSTGRNESTAERVTRKCAELANSG